MPMHLRERRPHLITARHQPEDKFRHERAEDFDNNANLANYVLSPDAHIAHLRRSARGIIEVFAWHISRAHFSHSFLTSGIAGPRARRRRPRRRAPRARPLHRRRPARLEPDF